jgi:uncharacterized RDD family membrane protein YckC
MKCPKCHYISFGSIDRCRNCGYEFLLAVEAAPVDLPIQSGEQALGPLADFVLTDRGLVPPTSSAPEPGASGAAGVRRAAAANGASRFDLPLFTGGTGGSSSDAPLVTPSAIPRTPLSVRRGQPAPTRPRSDGVMSPDNPDDVEGNPVRILRVRDARSSETAFPRAVPPAAPSPVVLETASVLARVLAGLVDILVLAAIDGAIVFSTLRIVGLPITHLSSLPPVPLAVFLLLLNGGYLAIFTTAGGQTIGKMLARIRVVVDRAPADPGSQPDVQGVSLGAAVLRATAYLVSLLPAGLGFAAILFDADGRALHDRLAETRVVKA